MLGDGAVLFCPADRPDRYAKALSVSRSIIIDLEDAVAPTARADARRALGAALRGDEGGVALDAAGVLVRVNPLGGEDGRRDIAALEETGHRRIMVAKAEDPDEIDALPGFEIVALIETLAGLDAMDDIARSPGCVGLMWGGDDFTADLGGRASRRPDGTLLPHAQHLRVSVLLAARRHGIMALDGPLLKVDDPELLADEAFDAARMGFAGKTAIHPRQVPTIREVFEPSAAEVERARRIIALSEKAGGGVAVLDGLMIDGPVVLQARAILDAARSD